MNTCRRWLLAAAFGAMAFACSPNLWADQAGGPDPFGLSPAGGQSAPGGGTGTVRELSGVPAYFWYNGCGPTSAGMIIGYWDARGFGNLISGSNDWDTNEQAVKDMIASPQHISEYSLYNGVDDSVTALYLDMSSLDRTHAHANNCVADFMRSSFSVSGNKFGWSWFTDQDDAMKNYAIYRGYASSTAYQRNYSNGLWAETMSFIDAGKPVQFLVDSNGDGSTDHFVTVIGYDNTPGALMYEALNTWDFSAHWYNYDPLTGGVAWGVYGGTFFTPAPVPEPGTCTLLIVAGLLILRRQRAAAAKICAERKTL